MFHITIFLVIMTSLVSILAFQNQELSDKLRFNAWLIFKKQQGWRFLSYGLIHADWLHLMVNMFVLYSFGPFVEEFYRWHYGPPAPFYFLLLYIGGLAFSVAGSFARQKENPHYNAVGASGAVSAIVFAVMVFEPMAPLRIMFIPIDIPAILFGLLYLVYSAWMAKKGTDNIGHDAHFLGAIFGLVFTIALKPSLFLSMIQKITSVF
ncbi:MAG TPA: rhomboid family intramembrane serine protease [Bacteroidales bacterium]|nr:MAG: hypothetical protein A2X11_13955 [Bacteroidetes bacterium GWE2_42_24]OFY28302.1 MAG: hypothetical protein A2X09_16185 [Bacteroidetes bacterium GWF2_43_11]HAQ64502.1 rhomboid family intramembrane serine protease [Bacteroidales bacterium]HBZ66216.1 rhomboid family intramembrane serine protease [Bacteroidales bacterium]